MSKKFKIVNSDDALTIIVEGNPKNPEPSTAVIKFPGGSVEVSRTADGSYWAHITRLVNNAHVIDSRVDFASQQAWLEKGIPHFRHMKKSGISPSGSP